MKNLTLISLLLCFFSVLSLKSQQVLSTSGTTFQNQSCTVSFTVGETIIGNLQNSTCLVSQGFQQSLMDATSITEKSLMNEVILFPNPVSGILNITGIFCGYPVSITIRDIHGNLVFSTSVFNESSVDLSGLTKGFYVVSIESRDTLQIEKLIIN